MSDLRSKLLHIVEIIVCIGLTWWAYPQFIGLRLSEAIYLRPSYAFEAFTFPFFIGIVIIALFLLIFDRIPNTRFYNSISWKSMDQGHALRFLIGFSTVVLAWKFSNNGYNYYLNQGHLTERLLIIFLWSLILAHPVFVPIFFGFTIVVMNELVIPYGTFNYSLTDKSLVLAMATMFSVWLLVRFLTRSRTSTLIFLFLCMIGAHYFIAGLEKITLGAQPWDWVLYNRLDNLFVSSYTHGWLFFLDESTILQIASIIRVLNVPLQILTIITEISVIFIVSNRKVTILILFGAIAMHIGIVLASGIFFWKWIVFELALLIFLATRNKEWLQTLYTPYLFGFSFIIILFSNFYFHGAPLGWFDSKINHVFKIEAITTSGEVYNVSPGVMQPFDIIFAQNRFFFLSDQYVATFTMGAMIDYESYQQLEMTTSAEEGYALEQEIGRQYFSGSYSQQFRQFMQQYFGNLNKVTTRNDVLPFLPSTPKHILFGTNNPYQMQDTISMIRVSAQNSYYHNGQLFVEEWQLLTEIWIPQPE